MPLTTGKDHVRTLAAGVSRRDALRVGGGLLAAGAASAAPQSDCAAGRPSWPAPLEALTPQSANGEFLRQRSVNGNVINIGEFSYQKGSRNERAIRSQLQNPGRVPAFRRLVRRAWRRAACYHRHALLPVDRAAGYRPQRRRELSVWDGEPARHSLSGNGHRREGYQPASLRRTRGARTAGDPKSAGAAVIDRRRGSGPSTRRAYQTPNSVMHGHLLRRSLFRLAGLAVAGIGGQPPGAQQRGQPNISFRCRRSFPPVIVQPSPWSRAKAAAGWRHSKRDPRVRNAERPPGRSERVWERSIASCRK